MSTVVSSLLGVTW